MLKYLMCPYTEEEREMDDRTTGLGAVKMEEAPGVPHRLRVVQKYAGCETQDEIADYLGIVRTTWTNILNGRELSKDVAFRIHAKIPEITLEWLWLGETRQLMREALLRLEQISREIR